MPDNATRKKNRIAAFHAAQAAPWEVLAWRRVIERQVKAAGGYVVTQWNKPDDLHPWYHDPNYVAHMSFDGVPTAEAIANELFKAFGGEGGIVALGGILSNVPAIERKLGLDNAIAKTDGKVTLLASNFPLIYPKSIPQVSF